MIGEVFGELIVELRGCVSLDVEAWLEALRDEVGGDDCEGLSGFVCLDLEAWVEEVGDGVGGDGREGLLDVLWEVVELRLEM